MPSRRDAVLGLAATPLFTATIASHSTESKFMNASGTFDVILAPQAVDNEPARIARIDRLSIDKKYHGALQGTSSGQMQAIKDDQNTGAYVALEKVVASLNGRNGTFMLMHYGYMSQGAVGRWLVEVVPHSGTDQLAGLGGTMSIFQKDKQHSYEFEYLLSDV
jgi:hypothetical protein